MLALEPKQGGRTNYARLEDNQKGKLSVGIVVKI